jgi:hypothetical protein
LPPLLFYWPGGEARRGVSLQASLSPASMAENVSRVWKCSYSQDGPGVLGLANAGIARLNDPEVSARVRVALSKVAQEVSFARQGVAGTMRNLTL